MSGKKSLSGKKSFVNGFLDVFWIVVFACGRALSWLYEQTVSRLNTLITTRNKPKSKQVPSSTDQAVPSQRPGGLTLDRLIQRLPDIRQRMETCIEVATTAYAKGAHQRILALLLDDLDNAQSVCSEDELLRIVSDAADVAAFRRLEAFSTLLRAGSDIASQLDPQRRTPKLFRLAERSHAQFGKKGLTVILYRDALQSAWQITDGVRRRQCVEDVMEDIVQKGLVLQVRAAQVLDNPVDEIQPSVEASDDDSQISDEETDTVDIDVPARVGANDASEGDGIGSSALVVDTESIETPAHDSDTSDDSDSATSSATVVQDGLASPSAAPSSDEGDEQPANGTLRAATAD